MAHHVKPGSEPTQSRGAISIDNSSENLPSKNLWIGSVMPDVTDSELKALFESHGEVIGVNSYPSRNYAFVYFKELAAAGSARQRLQGHVLHGNRLKIDFAKPQSFSQAKPCTSLWVARISKSVTKEELEKEFLKFGLIKEVRFLRDRNNAYVDYVRLEDAIRALRSMNGKQIGGDQIRVDFLRSQYLRREQGPDAKQVQFSSRLQEDSLKNYPQPSLAGTERQTVITDFNVYGLNTERQDAVQMDLQSLSQPALPGRPPFLGLGARAISDFGQLQRDSRRSKFDTDLSIERTGNEGGLGEQDAVNLRSSGGTTVCLTSVPTDGLGKLQSESNSMWRGIIAKGGIPICRAQCVPIGEGIDAHMPEVINCSERTRLDSLSKHYDNAIGFSTVYFLPDSENDFASYMEFMSYLVYKDRAGVIKFDNGTTLFLVPPSFLSKVLAFSGPECLYGVVLKFSASCIK